MSVRLSVSVLFVVCCLISGTSAWFWFDNLPNIHEEVPEDCPHSNNVTHVCSSTERATFFCKYWHCCGDNAWDENEDTDEETDCPNGICYSIRLCTYYYCIYSCCDGYEGHWQTGCYNSTGELECQNGGTRRTGYGGIQFCICLPGFRGQRCQIPICHCEHMGNCVVRNNEPVCECPDGFTGTNCEQAICAEDCLNGGTCTSDGNDSFCICPTGYVGDQCEDEYINSEKCPSPDPYSSHQDIRLECTSDEDCGGEKVCCNEGSSLICRQPKPISCNYKGTEYALNSYFKPEPCLTCHCLETGVSECYSVACAMPVCEDGQDPVVQPEQCCPTCPPESCTVDGSTYEHGTTFKIDCNTCSCWDGGVACTLIACGTTPEPITCEHNGNIYVDGETFMDDCNECSCRSGSVACTEMECPEPTCEHNGIIYSDGVTFMDDCNECTCTSGLVACTEMACPPKEPCVVESGENINIYESGTTFEIECNTCQCFNGTYACTKMNCACTLPCENDGRCMSEGEHEKCQCVPPFQGELCQIKYENPEKCPEPEPWALEYTEACQTGCESNEDCDGDEVCCMEGCHMICRVPEKVFCEYEGRRFTPGDSYSPDPCKFCECSVDGSMMCAVMDCTWPECPDGKDPVHLPDKCCPVCPACTLPCENDGRCISEGEHEKCQCVPPFQGELCQIKYENPEKCPEPEPWALEYTEACRTGCESNEDCDGDEVCCMEGCHMICRVPEKVFCEYEGRRFTPGDSYSPDPCKFCECSVDGSMMCAVTDCARPECPDGKDPVHLPDKCCPVCPEPPTGCLHRGQPYQDGESFKDDCNTCNCYRGEVSCTKMACPVRPELKCPDYVVELLAPPESSSVYLTKELTKVKAKAEGRDIQVRFDPSYAHHCRCHDSDSAVYTAVAYASYNGIRESCEFSYTVKDVTPPVFVTCPEDMYVFEHEEITYKKPKYWDNVGIAKRQCAMDPYRRTYPPGNYSFKYKVMDFEGNHACCTFMLSVSSSDTPFGQLPQGLKNRSNGPHIAMIVAPIAGLLMVILMVVLFLWCCRFKRAQNNAGAPQHRPRDAFDNHIYAIPADVKAPDYNSLPPNPPAYQSDNISMQSDYTFLPPPEYKEVEKLEVPTGYVNPDYSTIGSVKDESHDA